MSNYDDFKRMVHGGEPPEDNLKYVKVDPMVLGGLVSECYLVTVISYREYLEIVLRNLHDQTLYHSLHIYNPAFIEMTSWKAGGDGLKYVIDNSKV